MRAMCGMGDKSSNLGSKSAAAPMQFLNYVIDSLCFMKMTLTTGPAPTQFCIF